MLSFHYLDLRFDYSLFGKWFVVRTMKKSEEETISTVRCVGFSFPPGIRLLLRRTVFAAALQESYATLGFLSYRLDCQLLKLTEVDLLMTFHHSLYRV